MKVNNSSVMLSNIYTPVSKIIYIEVILGWLLYHYFLIQEPAKVTFGCFVSLVYCRAE